MGRTKLLAARVSPPMQSLGSVYPLTHGSGGYWLTGLKTFVLVQPIKIKRGSIG